MTPLEPSAILEGRTSNRASTGLIVGLVISGVCLLLMLGYYLVAAGPVLEVIGVVLAVPTTVVMVGLVLLIDRLEPEPLLKLLFVFLWGAGVAILAALILNTAGSKLFFDPVFGKDLGEYFSASFGAPLVEETCKGAVLFLLLWRRRDEINGATDGIIYAAMVGLGFALVENVLYYIMASAGGWKGIIGTVVIRGMVSPLCHPLFTSMTGLGVAFAARRRDALGYLAIAGGWIAAMFLHFSWNFSSALGPPIVIGFVGVRLGTIVDYLFLACVLAVVIFMLVRDRHRIIRLIQRYLPMYGQFGIASPTDLQMLSTLSARSAARKWSAGQFGSGGKKAMREYQLAATELAMLHDHAETRTVEPQRFAMRRDGLVHLMRATHNVFAPGSVPGPQPGPQPGPPGPQGPAPTGPYGPAGPTGPHGAPPGYGGQQPPYGPPGGQPPHQPPPGGRPPYGGQPPYGGPPQSGGW